MGKRTTALGKEMHHPKKTAKRLAVKKRMLELKAMKPAERKKALLGEQ